jgi:hypothetical protein
LPCSVKVRVRSKVFCASTLRTFQLRLPRCDDFRPGSDEYIGKLRLGNRHRRLHLLELRDRLGIIDPGEYGVCRDVLAVLDRYFLDPSIDPSRYVQPGCIGLALYQQRFRTQEIEHG